MKTKIISVFFCLFLFCTFINSQQLVPTDGEAFYNKAMSSINTKHVSWIKSTSVNVKTQNIDEAGIRKLASDYGRQNNFNNMDVEALAALIMMQCAKDQDQELKNMMEEMKKVNEQKQRMREAIEVMEQNKNAMSRQMLDSLKLLTTAKPNTVTKPQATRVQTVPTATKVTTPVVTKVSDVEIREMQDAIKIKHDSMSDLSDAQSLQMQKQMERRSKLMEAISNMMKKIAGTQESIIQNMK